MHYSSKTGHVSALKTGNAVRHARLPSGSTSQPGGVGGQVVLGPGIGRIGAEGVRSVTPAALPHAHCDHAKNKLLHPLSLRRRFAGWRRPGLVYSSAKVAERIEVFSSGLQSEVHQSGRNDKST